jgi:hypothetical protein
MKSPRQPVVRTMRIESSRESLGMNGLWIRAAVRATRVMQNPMALDVFGERDEDSSNIDAVRPEEVARAKTLVADRAYPSGAILGKVADVLSRHLGTKEA